MASGGERFTNDLFEEALSDSLRNFSHITQLKEEQKRCLLAKFILHTNTRSRLAPNDGIFPNSQLSNLLGATSGHFCNDTHSVSSCTTDEDKLMPRHRLHFLVLAHNCPARSKCFCLLQPAFLTCKFQLGICPKVDTFHTVGDKTVSYRR